MENFTKYLSTAPVVAAIWMTFTAGLIIEMTKRSFIVTDNK